MQIIQIIIDKELYNNDIIIKNTFFYGFLTQIIDDFNDIEIDLDEKNITLFEGNNKLINDNYCLEF